jgi:chromosome segregation ATPase
MPGATVHQYKKQLRQLNDRVRRLESGISLFKERYKYEQSRCAELRARNYELSKVCTEQENHISEVIEDMKKLEGKVKNLEATILLLTSDPTDKASSEEDALNVTVDSEITYYPSDSSDVEIVYDQ